MSLSTVFGSGALTFFAVPLAYATCIHAKALGGAVFRRKVGYLENIEPRRMAEHPKLSPEEAASIRRSLAAQANGFEALVPLAAGVALAVATKSPLAQTDAIVAAFLTSRVLYNYAYFQNTTPRAGALRSLVWLSGTILSVSLFGIAFKNS